MGVAAGAGPVNFTVIPARLFVAPSAVATVTFPVMDAVEACGSALGLWANPGIAQFERMRSKAPRSKRDGNLALEQNLFTGRLHGQIVVPPGTLR